MTFKKTATFGTSKVPNILPYSAPINQLQQIHNLHCHIIRHYGSTGVSILVYRQPQTDEIVVVCGDWKSNKLDITGSSDLEKLAKNLIDRQFKQLIEIMRCIKLQQAQFFFNRDLVLVDIQLSLNKFASPGFIKEVFGNFFETQKILKTEIVDDRAIEYVLKGSGSYEGDLIIKPSKFRLFNQPGSNSYSPLYVEVKR